MLLLHTAGLCAKMYLLSNCSVSLEDASSMCRVLREYVMHLPSVSLAGVWNEYILSNPCSGQSIPGACNE